MVPRIGSAIFILSLPLVMLTGCAPPLDLKTVATAPVVVVPSPTDTTGATLKPRVQLRYFSFSPTVSVVAWDPTDYGYGLRGWIRRDGSLIRDHRIYVSTWYDPGVRAFPYAVVPSQPLLPTGISRDIYACYFGSCSPYETFGARIPDKILRAAGDSIDVKFYAPLGRELILTVRRDLIDAYLAAIDSVSAALRKRS